MSVRKLKSKPLTLLEEKLVTQQEGRITPTLRGFLYNNQLIRRLGVG